MHYTKTGIVALLAILAVGCDPKANAPTAAAPAGGEASVADVTFASAIQPIVAQRCAKCHVEETKGRYSLASLESALAGGKSGPGVVVPGNGEGSLLYQMVAGKAEKRMPPKGDPLSDQDIATIKAWIDSGAH